MSAPATQTDPKLLARVAPMLRGLLAEPTDDPDCPWRSVILRSSTSGDQPASALVISQSIAHQEDAALRQSFAAEFEGYRTQHGSRPSAVAVHGVGVFQTASKLAAAPGPLAGKVAVVTGAAGAIGHGICRGLLEAGACVAATDISEDGLKTLTQEFKAEHGERIAGFKMDVTDAASVADAFAQVCAAWGGVDIVIINAGIAYVAALAELPLEVFQRLERINVEGTLLTLTEGARLMRAQGTGGDFVLVSTKNVFAPGARFGAYSATKAASHQLARIASLELAEFDIRVNMVAPDGVFSDDEKIKSGLWATVGPDRMKARGLDEKGLEEYYRNRNLLKARITARHVSNAVLFFVTRQTPTTGATIPVDGGLPDATPR